ncbi:threonylcarbamoyladenosine tRNA methylthiotransferase [Drosophila sulfurigaster albostrigata]|uniref:threonylcarbamoyladenosine tRNA methylthiotransferase n=1 Tax=Drosophila sulfurigaster albostrigata TaxID=89887 RepID=UPI002D21E32D|nr:threonylcarbamoyladenosine tRNA methylthiotransferase [Drosophila sulfurigaster albostrigata]
MGLEVDLPGNDIDDIEDLISSDDIKPRERYENKKSVTVRAKRRAQIKPASDNDEKTPQPQKTIYESVIPGTQKVYVKTWGCAHNNSDSEYMAGQLAAYGYNLSGKDDADLWLLNSCTVKNPSEDTFRNEIESGMRSGKHVVVAGCVPQGAPKADYLRGLSVIGVQQIDRVVEVVEETLKGHSVRLLQNRKVHGRRVAGAPLSLPKVRKNPLIEIISINSGCLNQCTYCKTKHARGDLASYPPAEIVERARQSFDEGCCEIWLTSEDTGAYGRDIGSSLPELLWQLVEVIPENCMLRVGMTNPPYILEHLEEVAKVLQHPRVYAFLHVPVQSGSDSVLGEMKREYCRKDFEHVVDFLRARVPGLTIATDIICGFPTETEEDFEETMTLCAKHRFPSLFINQFFPRPGTPAAKMERIPANLVKKRTKRLTDLFYSYEPYAGREGQVYEVLVTEISHDKQHYVGHNKSYEQVLLPMRDNLLGTRVRVRITSTSKFSMMAEILDEERDWTRCDNNNKAVTTECLTQSRGQRFMGIALLVGALAFLLHLLLKFVSSQSK